MQSSVSQALGQPQESGDPVGWFGHCFWHLLHPSSTILIKPVPWWQMQSSVSQALGSSVHNLKFPCSPSHLYILARCKTSALVRPTRLPISLFVCWTYSI